MKIYIKCSFSIKFLIIRFIISIVKKENEVFCWKTTKICSTSDSKLPAAKKFKVRNSFMKR